MTPTRKGKSILDSLQTVDNGHIVLGSAIAQGIAEFLMAVCKNNAAIANIWAKFCNDYGPQIFYSHSGTEACLMLRSHRQEYDPSFRLQLTQASPARVERSRSLVQAHNSTRVY